MASSVGPFASSQARHETASRDREFAVIFALALLLDAHAVMRRGRDAFGQGMPLRVTPRRRKLAVPARFSRIRPDKPIQAKFML